MYLYLWTVHDLDCLTLIPRCLCSVSFNFQTYKLDVETRNSVFSLSFNEFDSQWVDFLSTGHLFCINWSCFHSIGSVSIHWSCFHSLVLFLFFGSVSILWFCFHSLFLFPFFGPVSIYWSCFHSLVLFPFIGPVFINWSCPVSFHLSYFHSLVLFSFICPISIHWYCFLYIGAVPFTLVCFILIGLSLCPFLFPSVMDPFYFFFFFIGPLGNLFFFISLGVLFHLFPDVAVLCPIYLLLIFSWVL